MANSGQACGGPFNASTDSLAWQTSLHVGTVEEEVATHESSSDTLAVCSDISDLYLFFGRKENNLK
jgi:hypothetical protein